MLDMPTLVDYNIYQPNKVKAEAQMCISSSVGRAADS